MLGALITIGSALASGIASGQRRKKAKKLAKKIQREQEAEAARRAELLEMQRQEQRRAFAETMAERGFAGTPEAEFQKELMERKFQLGFESISGGLRQQIYSGRMGSVSQPGWFEQFAGGVAAAGQQYFMNRYLWGTGGSTSVGTGGGYTYRYGEV